MSVFTPKQDGSSDEGSGRGTAPRRRFRRAPGSPPLRNLLPNILTVLALCAGLTAIRFGLEGRYEFAVYAILIAALFDMLDGRVARLLQAQSAALPALAWGGHLVLQPKFDARGFLELAQKFGATHSMLVPVQYRRIMDLADFEAFDLGSYRMKFCTSAPFAADLKADILARWPGGLIEYWGMTEGGGGTALVAHEHPTKLHTIGRPFPNVELKIVKEDGTEAAPGEVGEMIGFSPATMSGYANRPEATRATQWQHPDGRIFIRTGDLARRDEDGFIELMGRAKDMIISGGFNIYPIDIEQVLAEHPHVLDVFQFRA